MTAVVDEGLFPGNYEDYLNDDVAKQREYDLIGRFCCLFANAVHNLL